MTNIQVEAIDYTGKGTHFIDGGFPVTPSLYAAALLAFTKNTRLTMNADGFDHWLKKAHHDWPAVQAELDYMAGTIPSSWEFVDFTFSVRNVSRACAQQMTRTRFTPMDCDLFGSYAMQSQRVTDMSEATWCNPIRDRGGDEDEAHLYDEDIADSISRYEAAVKRGMDLQDARGQLPMNLHCSLVVKLNLRTIVEMVRARENAVRVQGEFVEVVRQIKEEVLKAYPWAETFFEPRNVKATKMIQEVIADDELDPALKLSLAKALDLIKKG